jgi:predicted DCC family thiol-disulfide oxidoreductase YuxK
MTQSIVESQKILSRDKISYSLLEIFSIDLRSLAVFRIAISLVLIYDTISWFSVIEPFLSDFGVLRRATLLDEYISDFAVSLHLLSGQSFFIGLLLTVQLFFAFMLLIGYRTRVASIVIWLLVASLQIRNGYVMSGADGMLRLLLFWSMFVPLGAYYSVDRALSLSANTIKPRYLSAGSIGLMLQLLSLYVFTFIFKWDSAWFENFSAVYYALNIDIFATSTGVWLRGFPQVMAVLTFLVIWFEIIGPILIFSPVRHGQIRMLTILAFIGFHLSLSATLEIDFFPYICIAGWMMFLPTWFWDKVLPRLETDQRKKLVIYYDSDCGFCKKSVLLIKTFFLISSTPIRKAQEYPEIFNLMEENNSWVISGPDGANHYGYDAWCVIVECSPVLKYAAFIFKMKFIHKIGTRTYNWVANNRDFVGKITAFLYFRELRIRPSLINTLLSIFFIVVITYWNINTLKNDSRLIPSIWRVANIFQLYQRWDMFAPQPMTDDGWYVVPGELSDGTEVNVWKPGEKLDWEKPELVSNTFPHFRWRKYLTNISFNNYSSHRLHFSRYLCRRWSADHPDEKPLKTFKIFYMRETTPPPGIPLPDPEKVLLWNHQCYQ